MKGFKAAHWFYCILAVLIISCAGIVPAHAATISVTANATDTLGANGQCSLREAITNINNSTATYADCANTGAAYGTGDTINIPAGTYTTIIAGANEDLNATGDYDINKSVAIIGAGASTTFIDGGGLDRVFNITGAFTVSISGVTIQNGNEGLSAGGGISNLGTLTITNSTISVNSTAIAGGGGINTNGALTITKSTISGNTAAASGGGIFIDAAGTLDITNSTISGNSATSNGGGIFLFGTTLNATNCTFSGNTAGILGPGIARTAGTATLSSTIVNDGCSGVITSGNYNLDSGTTCASGGAGDLQNTNPLLGALANKGGTTQTLALTAGSPAIDAGPAACAGAPVNGVDQRGTARPLGGACDIGAYEAAVTTYTVTFDGNGSDGGTTSAQTAGVATNLTANGFTRTGYTFTGWNTVALGGGTAYADTASYPFTANTTLYAQWTINSYTVTFDGNGGTGGATAAQSANYNVTTNLTSNGFTKTGYTFAGWNTVALGGGTAYANGAPYPFTSSVTLYAQWTINSYTVTFDTNGGTGGATAAQSANYNVATNLTSNGFTKTGYTFAGWNTVALGGGTAYANGAPYPFTSSVTLYAQWTINTYTLSYTAGANGSLTGTTPQAVNYNASGSAVTAVPATGYHFVNWSDASTANPRTDSNVTGNIIVTANFAIDTYTVTYHANGSTGGAVPTDNNSPYNYNATVTVLGNTGALVKTGYTFDGWYGTSAIYKDGDTFTIETDTTLYAKWKVKTGKITYNSNGGDGTMDKQTVEYNKLTPLNKNTFNRTGYTFTGWNTRADGSGKPYDDGASYRFTTGVTLYAQWKINTYTVTFDSNGGSGLMSSQSENYNVTKNLTANTFKRTGYTFTGWNTVAGGVGGTAYADKASYTFTADIKLYAQWKAKPYTGTGTITVTTTDDKLDGTDGKCSLREAITNVNDAADTYPECIATGTGSLTINIPAGTYTITIVGADEDKNAKGDYDILKNVAIVGAGAGSTIIDGGGIDRVFHIIGSPTVSISSVTIKNGNAGDKGGGIYNSYGTVIVTNSTISGNTADYGGGGISNSLGTVTVTNSTISGNTGGKASGGGIYNSYGTVTVTNSTISGNTVGKAGSGGGIYNSSGTVTVTNSTISNNTAYAGGGIFNFSTLTVTNTTLSNNTAYAGGGGGIYNFSTATVTNTTLSNNTANAGGGIFNYGTLTVTNTTISGNTAYAGGGGISNIGTVVTVTNTIVTDSCSGTITSNGHNLESSSSCGFTGTGDLQNTDPKLGPLADSGGPTLTHVLLPGSPAINKGDATVCAGAQVKGLDQRGTTRPQGSCDIGAYEYLAATSATTTSTASTYLYMQDPVLDTDPKKAKAIGVGNIATGGNTLSIKIGLNAFAQPVDLYLIITVSDLSSYSVGPDKALHKVSASNPLVKWKSNVTVTVNESVFGDIPASSLPPGLYVIKLIVLPAGSNSPVGSNLSMPEAGAYKAAAADSENPYWVWGTSFNVQATTGSGIPTPSGQQTFEYQPAVFPVRSDDPALAEPISLGSIAFDASSLGLSSSVASGSTLNINVGLNAFTEPVDIYIAAYVSGVYYLLGPDNSFQSLETGIVKWKSDQTDALDESLFGDIATASLPSGRYELYLFATPAGSIDSYYNWKTYFVIP